MSYKICHLSSVHGRYDVRIFVKECQSLKNEGFSVSFVVADGLGDEIRNGINIIDVGKPKNRFERFLKITKRVYKRAILIDADIYHFHDPEFLQFVNKFRRLKKPTVYDVHEDVPAQILSKYWIPKIFRKLVSYCYNYYEKRKSQKLTAIITATDYIKDNFTMFNPNVISVKNYPVIKQKNLFKGYSSENNKICYIGGISRVRGITELIESLKTVDAKLLLAGNFDPPEYKNVVSKIESWDKVEELGFLNSEKISELLNSSAVGIVTLYPEPNYINSLPVKLFEYMEAGIPVVASDIKKWKEIVDENNCGICVNPFNSDEISNAINFLLSNPQKAKEMGENGRKAVEEKYNWEKEKNKLIEIYNKITNNISF